MKSSISKVSAIWATMLIIALLSVVGCARVGVDFNAQQVQSIEIGKTTQNDIIETFGQPWRKGIEDGVTMWTYGRYTYRLIGDADTKDLIVKFNKEGKVSSYTFNETVDKK